MKLINIPPKYLNKELALKIYNNPKLRKQYITKFFKGGRGGRGGSIGCENEILIFGKEIKTVRFNHINTSKEYINIPSEIGNFLNLQYLTIDSLTGYKLTGQIPDEIYNLTNLESLKIVNNFLDCNISQNIQNLTNLQTLILSNNNLNGIIPDGIQHLTKLQTLNLSNNNLNGIIPDEIKHLTNLSELQLSNNNLTNTNLNIILLDLTKLDKIYLNGNLFKGNILEILNSIVKVPEILLLQNNYLTFNFNFNFNGDDDYYTLLGHNIMHSMIEGYTRHLNLKGNLFFFSTYVCKIYNSNPESYINLVHKNLNSLTTDYVNANVNNSMLLQSLIFTSYLHIPHISDYKRRIDKIIEFQTELKDNHFANAYIHTGHGNVKNSTDIFVVPENVTLIFKSSFGKLSYEDQFQSRFEKIINNNYGHDYYYNNEIYFENTLCVNEDISYFEQGDERVYFYGIYNVKPYYMKYYRKDGGGDYTYNDVFNSGYDEEIISHQIGPNKSSLTKPLNTKLYDIILKLKQKYPDKKIVFYSIQCRCNDDNNNVKIALNVLQNLYKNTFNSFCYYDINDINQKINKKLSITDKQIQKIEDFNLELYNFGLFNLNLFHSNDISIFENIYSKFISTTSASLIGSPSVIQDEICKLIINNTLILDQSGNIINIKLNINTFAGKIPREIGQLSKLIRLNLWETQLTGRIPPEIGNLNELQQIWLSHNRLTDSIPSEIGQLSKLTVLNLSNNKLTGQIPLTIGQLSELTILRLSNNQLTGPIPPEIGQLSNLVYLDFSQNKLTDPIPPKIEQLSNLVHLDFSQNQLLTGSISDKISKLKTINIHHTNITIVDV
jgi:Leucine-rich repeat (LRR) protein